MDMWVDPAGQHGSTQDGWPIKFCWVDPRGFCFFRGLGHWADDRPQPTSSKRLMVWQHITTSGLVRPGG